MIIKISERFNNTMNTHVETLNAYSQMNEANFKRSYIWCYQHSDILKKVENIEMSTVGHGIWQEN